MLVVTISTGSPPQVVEVPPWIEQRAFHRPYSRIFFSKSNWSCLCTKLSNQSLTLLITQKSEHVGRHNLHWVSTASCRSASMDRATRLPPPI